jgi:hypothetical protein
MLCFFEVGISQPIISESVFFPAGQSSLSKRSREQLNVFIQKGARSSNWHIIIKAWQDKDEETRFKAPLSRERLRRIYSYLIANKFGEYVHELKIITDDSLLKDGTGNRHTGRVDIIIANTIPCQDQQNIYEAEEVLICPERDTVLQGPAGILVKIKAGSFDTGKIPDYRFEIKFFNTTEEIAVNNISTVTTDKIVVDPAFVICIWAIPKDSSLKQPAKLLKSATILVPAKDDLPGADELSIFRKIKGSRFSYMWKAMKTEIDYDTISGKRYFSFLTLQLGFMMAGKITGHICTSCLVKTPAFSIQKYRIVYATSNIVILFQEKNERWMLLPCPTDINLVSISGYATDDSGRIYRLELNSCDFPSRKSHHKLLKIRKRDFVKVS